MGGISADLRGEVALVTGGSKGIGKAVALALAAAGAHVAVVSRTMSDVRAVAEEIVAQGGSAADFTCDVASVPTIGPLVQEVLEKFGKIDILVNSAGINIPRYAVEVTEEDWDRVMDVNLKGTFFMCQAVGKTMIPRRKGKIINISSQMGLVGYFKRAAYCSSKGGVVQLTRALAIEWAEYGINVNSVAPTFLETALTAPMFADPVFRNEVVSRIPLGRIGRVDDVTGAVLYLASDAANLVTGHTLLVDGGWTAW